MLLYREVYSYFWTYKLLGQQSREMELTTANTASINIKRILILAMVCLSRQTYWRIETDSSG